jgi:hypothetical protein
MRKAAILAEDFYSAQYDHIWCKRALLVVLPQNVE